MSKEALTPSLKPEAICTDCDRIFVLCTTRQAECWAKRANRCPSCDNKRPK